MISSASFTMAATFRFLLFGIALLVSRIGVDAVDLRQGGELKIAVELSAGYPEAWKELEKYLNRGIKERGENFAVRIDAMPIEALIRAVTSGEVHGALLPPLRYVLADLERPLEPVARLLRGQLIRNSAEQPPTKEQTRDGLETYSSVIVMRRNSSAWPPEPGTTNFVLGASGPLSTSGFLYPAFWLVDQLSSRAVTGATPSDFRVQVSIPSETGTSTLIDLAEAVANPMAWEHPGRESDGVKVVKLFESLATNSAPFSFMGIGLDRFKKLLNSEKNKELFDLGESPPIFFDVLAVDAEVAAANFDPLAALKDTLLSTRHLLHAQRTNLFRPVHRPSLGGWTFVPDIHSFEGTKDSEYDDLRRKWVRLSGGPVIRFGMSSTVHAQNPEAGLKYFRRVRRALMKPGKGKTPAFLQIEYRPDQTLQDLAAQLKSEQLDVIEAAAGETGRLIYEDRGTAIAIARFRDRVSGQSGIHPQPEFVNGLEHPFVILCATGKSHLLDLLGSSDRIAHPDERNSSGSRFPVHRLDKEKVSGGALRRRLLEVNDYLGVYKALSDYRENPKRTNAAKFGIMAEFQWNRLNAEFTNNGFYRLDTIDEGKIPNAMLVAGTHFVPPDITGLDLVARGKRLLIGIQGREKNPAEVQKRRAALQSFVGALNEAQPAIDPSSDRPGFIQYTIVPPEIIRHVREVHASFVDGVDWATLPVLALIVLGLLVLAAVRTQGSSRGQPDSPNTGHAEEASKPG